MFFALLLLLAVLQGTVNSCNIREVEYGLICVCNSTHCDTVPKLESLSGQQFQVFFTSKENLGYTTTIGQFTKEKRTDSVIKVNGEKYQKVVGFGGAFTDAAGINIRSLEKGAQENLLRSYFGEDGIEYSLCRVPMGGTDFSPRPYSHADYPQDGTLNNFKLQPEDQLNKIPFIKFVNKLNPGKKLKLVTSSWSAPTWMKTNNFWSGYSLLKENYYHLWAEYAVKFLNEYKKHDIDFWGITTGNEPMDGFYSNNYSKINAMAWIPHNQARWISDNLGPTLRASEHRDIKILIHDDTRLTLPYVVPQMLSNENAMKYIDGVAVHWYWDDKVPSEVLSFAKSNKKDVFLLQSEACYFLVPVHLGSWNRAADYIKSILEYLENGAVGWLDWNMALDLNGGPSYVGYQADSPIIVNAERQEFYKQPMYYAMGHFSKFVVTDSVRLGVTDNFSNQEQIKSMAFLRPDGLIAVIIFNSGDTRFPLQVEYNNMYSSHMDIAANSIYTIIFSSNITSENSEPKVNATLAQ